MDLGRADYPGLSAWSLKDRRASEGRDLGKQNAGKDEDGGANARRGAVSGFSSSPQDQAGPGRRLGLGLVPRAALSTKLLSL